MACGGRARLTLPRHAPRPPPRYRYAALRVSLTCRARAPWRRRRRPRAAQRCLLGCRRVTARGGVHAARSRSLTRRAAGGQPLLRDRGAERHRERGAHAAHGAQHQSRHRQARPTRRGGTRVHVRSRTHGRALQPGAAAGVQGVIRQGEPHERRRVPRPGPRGGAARAGRAARRAAGRAAADGHTRAVAGGARSGGGGRAADSGVSLPSD